MAHRTSPPCHTNAHSGMSLLPPSLHCSMFMTLIFDCRHILWLACRPIERADLQLPALPSARAPRAAPYCCRVAQSQCVLLVLISCFRRTLVPPQLALDSCHLSSYFPRFLPRFLACLFPRLTLLASTQEVRLASRRQGPPPYPASSQCLHLVPR